MILNTQILNTNLRPIMELDINGQNVDDDTIFFRYDDNKIENFENIKKK